MPRLLNIQHSWTFYFITYNLLLVLLSWPSSFTASAFLTDKMYPSFCSAPHDNAEREIPPLADDPFFTTGNIQLTLKHATVVTSEGLKVPSAMHSCWPDYDKKPADTASWDCSLSSLSASPAHDVITYLASASASATNIDNEETILSGTNPNFLFEKRYDANYSPSGSNHFPDMLGNELGGTCQLGQLTLQGHEQQRQNGMHLRKAYGKSDLGDLNVDVGMDRLLYDFDAEKSNTQFTKRAYDEPQLYVRSDDRQATIMSGQALLHGLFGDLMKEHAVITNYASNPVIRIHTSDHKNDILEPNYDICPVLGEIEEESLESERYFIDFLHSNEAVMMKELGDEFIGGWDLHEDPSVAMECIMTSICLDKTVPYVLNQEDSADDATLINRFGDDWGSRYSTFQSKRKSFKYTYSDLKFSQIASNPVWNDILSGLLSFFTDIDAIALANEWPDLRPTSKLALYSAHDTTIMALLASLGALVFNPEENPPYASMFIIELYEMDIPIGVEQDTEFAEMYPSKMAFRLIYNGEVKTSKISGCPPTREVCDVAILILHVFEFSDLSAFDEICKVSEAPTFDDSEDEPELETPHESLNIFEFTFTVLMSVWAGALGMFFYMNKSAARSTRIDTMEPEHLHLELAEVGDNNMGNQGGTRIGTGGSLYETAQTSETATII